MSQEIQIRPLEPGDLDGVLAVQREAMPHDPISAARFTRQVLLDANFQPAGMPVAVAGDEVVGFCLSLARQVPLENAPSDSERGYITLLAVRPAWKRQGIGGKLLAEAETYLRSQSRSIVMVASYAPGYFIPGVDVNAYPGGLAFLKKAGYVEVYRPVAMQASLWNLPEPDWLADRARPFEVRPFEPALALPLLEFTQAEFPGDWVRVVRETAGAIMAGESSTRLLTALDAGRVVGFAHFDKERFGPIGVAAAERGRGIGQVLMFATLRAQREAGYRSAWFLWSDDKTAERLYNAAGFRETRRFALMKKPLQGDRITRAT